MSPRSHFTSLTLSPQRLASLMSRTCVGYGGSCWMWMGKATGDGYGDVMVGGRRTGAHRALYLVLRGPVAEDMHLDHVCRNRLCVNPDHLEPVPEHVNILRGTSPTAHNALKTTCPAGHALPEYRLGGARQCLPCRAERARAKRRALAS